MGYVQIYTGNAGKDHGGHGSRLEALGAGFECLRRPVRQGESLPRFGLSSPGGGHAAVRQGFIRRREPTKEELECAAKGFAECREAATAGLYDLVVLDEVFAAIATASWVRPSCSTSPRAAPRARNSCSRAGTRLNPSSMRPTS
jgi:ATP:corrinoid adenosyltransferase